MYIKSITLHNLVAFQCAQIRTLTLTCHELFQLILGTNGSGKTSLMLQLSPMPAVSTDFLKNGYKVLEIDHKGKLYRLVSDFRKKGNAHEFWVEGENLNEGGTTDVQKELVTSHFNWSNEVQHLCYNTLSFCSLGPAQRELFFTNLNPDQIAFILEKNKKVKSSITVTKGIIQNLMERKLKLEEEMIEDEKLLSLEKENEELQNKGMEIYKQLCLVEKELEGLSPEHKDFTSYLSQVGKEVKSLYHAIHTTYNFPTGNLEEQKIRLSSQIDTYKETLLPKLTETLTELENKISTQKTELDKILSSPNEECLKHTIEMLEAKMEVEKIKSQTTYTYFTSSILENSHFLSSFETLLNKFTFFERPLYSLKRIALKMSHYSYWCRRLEELQRKKENLEEACEKLLFQKKQEHVDVPSSCEKEKCVLFQTFHVRQQSLQEEKDKKEKELRHIESQYKRLSHWVEKTQEQIHSLQLNKEYLQDLKELLGKYPEATPFFKNENTLSLLGTNPMVFYHRLHAHYEASLAHVNMNKTERTLSEEKIKLSQYQSHEKDMISSFQKEIEEMEKKLETLYTEYTQSQLTLQNLLLESEKIDLTLDLKKKLDFLIKDLDEKVFEQIQYKKYEIYKAIQQSLLEEQRQCQTRIGEITSILKTQGGIHERYEKEVLGQIKYHEDLLKNLTLIRDALTLIPKKRMSKFLNKVIRKVNRTISQVFTYDFKLDKLNEEDMNFKFPYLANNSQGKDISTCSTAQTEMTNLAFTLVCRELMELEDYPLFLDEVGKTFDMTHQRKLLDFLLYILDERKASQIFIVNHHSLIHSGINNAEVLVLHEANVLKPERYNDHVLIESY